MSGARVALACLIVVLGATSARAQTYRASQRPHFGSLEAGVGAVWVGGVDFGERRAVELRNPTTGTDPLLLFVTNSRLDPVGGLQGRFGFYLSPRLVVEAGARYSKPVLVTRVTDDFEEASDLVARARSTYESLEPREEVLVHGDLHHHNLLRQSLLHPPGDLGNDGRIRP